MTNGQIDMALCAEVWGADFEADHEYQAAVASIAAGRSANAVNEDLRERLNYRKRGADAVSARDAGMSADW